MMTWMMTDDDGHGTGTPPGPFGHISYSELITMPLPVAVSDTVTARVTVPA